MPLVNDHQGIVAALRVNAAITHWLLDTHV